MCSWADSYEQIYGVRQTSDRPRVPGVLRAGCRRRPGGGDSAGLRGERGDKRGEADQRRLGPRTIALHGCCRRLPHGSHRRMAASLYHQAGVYGSRSAERAGCPTRVRETGAANI
ncbi:unnamed protein product [Ectocarpus sp. 13 AM-2016]